MRCYSLEPTIKVSRAISLCHILVNQLFLFAFLGQSCSVDLFSGLGGLSGLIVDITSLAYRLWCTPASRSASSIRTLGSDKICKINVINEKQFTSKQNQPLDLA